MVANTVVVCTLTATLFLQNARTMNKSDEILSILKNLEPVLMGLVAGQAKLEAGQGRIETRLEAVEGKVDNLDYRVTRIEDRLDIAELRGRVEELSRRMPTSLAYVSPSG